MKPKTLTVLVDTREQQPLRFPEYTKFYGSTSLYAHSSLFHVKVEGYRMDSGDYAVKGYETVTICERKKNGREAYKNMATLDRGRAIAALDRLCVACKRPLLLIEQPPWTWFHGSHTLSPDDHRKAFDRLLTEAAKRGITVLCGSAAKPRTVDARRRLGEVVLHWMLATIVAEKGSL